MRIQDNTAFYAGAVMNVWGSNPTFANCSFMGNQAYNDGGASETAAGGGMCNWSSSPTLINCVISGNCAQMGGGIWCTRESYPVLINCTVASNIHGGIVVDSGITLANCILWGNTNCITQIEAVGSSPNVTYSCIQGGWPGVGNISLDPRFVDFAAGDFRLQAGSPCIDAGQNAAVPPDALDLDADGDTAEPVPTDLDHHARVIGATPLVDMGAYEFIPAVPGDFDANGHVDDKDLQALTACTTGPDMAILSGCDSKDLDGDADIDLDDFGILQRCYTGRNRSADPSCGQ